MIEKYHILISILEHVIELSLLHQSRLDPKSEERYNAEVSSVLYYNFPLLEVREYCDQFLARCDEYMNSPARQVKINSPNTDTSCTEYSQLL